MNILKEFDKALVLEQTRHNDVKSGYLVKNEDKEKLYNEYLHKEFWAKLLENMSEEHKKQYGADGGKELDEKDGKPPKMAAFASSFVILKGIT